jgi:class 3 adenylate cyclase/tetratricopeptide (TPR) repeat protein
MPACPGCQRANPDDAAFCAGCGRKLARVCPACERENDADARFCNGCGRRLDEAPTASAEAPARERSPRDYTPRHLADKILSSKSALEGERKQVTVLFADVKGSMDLAEQVDPEEWHRILNRFFEIMADGVHRFEGTVNQYTGDGIMALFGAPISHEDHAQRACYTALHLREELRRYSEELRIARGLDLSVRMGLNSGDVVVGKIGDDLRMDYTAQGHTVGLAARMEQIAAPDQAYLSEDTQRLVSGYFELRDLGPTRVRGGSEPVRVYALEGTGAFQTRLDVSRSRGLSRFVGRADEMGMLDAALAQAQRGNGAVVGVVAEAGTGKSRLCYEFLLRCRAQGMRVLESRAVAHGKNIPLLPILQLFRGYFGIEEQDSDRVAREKIAGRLLLIDEGLRDALPLVFELMAVPDPERPVAPGDPEARQRQLFGVQQRIVQRDEADPLVMLIEDLHWIDGASEAWLQQLVDSAAGSRNLLLVNFRPEYRADWMQKSYYHQLPLAPLGPEAVRELLADLLGSDPSTAGLAQAIHRRTAGNPFFTEEVVQALIESGSLQGSPGRYELVTPVDQLQVPATVHAVLAARIDRLAEREKQVLQTAAVIGKEFAEPILAEVAALPARELSEALGVLKDAEFLHERALFPVAEYAFKHPLTQEVALGSQLRERRAATHAAVARAIEAAHPDKLAERAAELAQHWEEAGETLLATRWHRRAAEWVGPTDCTQGVEHWQKVRKLAAALREDAEALEHQLVACQRWLGFVWRVGVSEVEIDEVFEEGRAVGEKLGDPDALLRLYVGLVPVLITKGLLTQAVEVAQNGFELRERATSPDSEALAHEIMADSTFWSGEVGRSLPWQQRVLELVGDDATFGVDVAGTPLLPWTLVRRAVLRAQQGELDRALRDIAEAMRIGREHGFSEVTAWANTLHGWIDEIIGDFDDTLARSQQAVELAERAQSPFTMNVAEQNLGFALLHAGDPQAALELLERSERFRVSRRTGLYAAPAEKADFAAAHLAVGNLDRARELVEEAQAFAAHGGANMRRPHVDLVQARILRAAEGRKARDRIEAILARADTRIRSTGAKAWGPFVEEERARVAELMGDPAGAERHLREALRSFEAQGSVGHAGRVTRELAD